MIIQNVIFPNYGVCSNYSLYFRLSNNYNYSFMNQFVFFNAGGWAHFDTYFNSFMKSKWAKYTNLNNLSLEISICGSFRVTLFNKERLNSGEVTNKIIYETELQSDKKQSFIIPFDNFVSDGMYGFSLYCLKDGGKFFGGSYQTAIDEEKLPEVHISVAICTYRREQYLIRNIDNIVKYVNVNKNLYLDEKIDIFISDNAKTIVRDPSWPSYIHLFSNINAGGAGGFTRCMIEILDDNNVKTTHILVMDDDITIEPETIYRTFTYLKLLKDEFKNITIGGSMLRLDTQNIQTECGAIWNGGALHSLKHNLDLTSCEACLYNDIEEHCDYNAWWYCVIPRSFVNANNLPLPIFIRGDDVEYGLRNSSLVVHLNGICVWHEPFENKYSSMMYYYIMRNRLIDNSVRSIDYPIKKVIKDFREQWNSEIRLYRYNNAHLLAMGIVDFLKGIDWLMETKVETINKEVMGLSYKLVPCTSLNCEFTIDQYLASISQKGNTKQTFSDLVKKKLKIKNKTVVVPVNNPPLDYCSDSKTILNYDYSSGKGFITEYCHEKYVFERRYYRQTIRLLKKRYSVVVEEYNKRQDELKSIDFWRTYLEL